MKSGCTSSPIFEEKHSESNVGQVPSSVEARQESGKRKANQMGLSTSLGQRRRNKDSDLEYDSEIINLCLTANLVHKVHDSSLQSKGRTWLQGSSSKVQLLTNLFFLTLCCPFYALSCPV